MPPHTFHSYSQEWRYQVALQLLEDLDVPANETRRCAGREAAEAFVYNLPSRRFLEACPSFYDKPKVEVLTNAIKDVTQLLREQNYLAFDEVYMPDDVSLQKSFNDGFTAGRRKQVEEALLDTTRAAVRMETQVMYAEINKRILEALEEKLKNVVRVAFQNLL